MEARWSADRSLLSRSPKRFFPAISTIILHANSEPVMYKNILIITEELFCFWKFWKFLVAHCYNQYQSNTENFKDMLGLNYCEWLIFRWVQIFVVFVDGPIHEIWCPQKSDFMYKLWKKMLWPRILNPTNIWFLVHLSRRLKCTIVFMRCPSSVRCLSVVVNFSYFRLLLWNRWTEFNETWQEARSQRPLQSLCFSGRSEKQDGRPGLWLADTFSTSALKPLNGIQWNLTGRKISTSSTKFAFFRPIGKTRWPSWPIYQKGGTLYSGARYVALWASCC